jgi:hypothetical protein
MPALGWVTCGSRKLRKYARTVLTLGLGALFLGLAGLLLMLPSWLRGHETFRYMII